MGDETATKVQEVDGKDPVAALGRVTEFLDRIVGPKRIVIQDITGAEHSMPGVLPARVEARFWRAVREIDGGQLEGQLQAIQSSKNEDVLANIASTVAAALSSDAVLDAADEVFVSAFPDMIAKARANAAEAGIQGSRASDLFVLGEIAIALSPFVVGGLRALGRLARTFLPPSPPT